MEKRLYFIDALRVIAILMMFIFHVFMIFVEEWMWHIKNEETSSVLLEINFWMSSFRMPLLFFVSGYISSILIKRMSWEKFVAQRFQRLIIPTFIWTFLLVAPQIYFENKLEGSQGNYFEFYQSFLQFERWPQGDFHWLHLWFIPYLFCYNLISIPIVQILNKRNKLSRILSNFSNQLTFIFVFVGIAILPYTFLYFQFPASYDLVNDLARHSFFFTFIMAGLVFHRYSYILKLLMDQRRLFLSLAFISILTINTIRWNGWEPLNLWENWQDLPGTYFYLALLNFNTWMWVLGCLGYGKAYLNKGNKYLTYANTAVYPFYILHQTVIVILAYYVVQTTDNLVLKLIFLLIICFCITLVTYHFFIRPYNSMRYLFGMKKKKEKKDL